MKKVLAMAIIMTSSTLIGMHLSKGMLSRVAELEKARVFIVYCRTQIRYASENFQAIIASYLDEHGSELPIFLSENVLHPAPSSIQSKILEGLRRQKTRQALKDSDISCLISFVSALGKGDIESQMALCDLYEELIQERLSSARQAAEKYAGIYTSLCALAGLALSILLI